MRIIDLTHKISQDMPMYPGSPAPVIKRLFNVEKDGFAESELKISSHSGTHIDAPCHMLLDGKELEDYEIETFFGNALMIDFPTPEKMQIEADDIMPFQARTEKIDFLVIRTGWSRSWGKAEYLLNFPCLTVEAAQLISESGLRGVGIDTPSIDSVDSETFPVHHVFFRQDMLIIENLTNLGSLSSSNFTFSCMPLRIEKADASPVRAFAIEY